MLFMKYIKWGIKSHLEKQWNISAHINLLILRRPPLKMVNISQSSVLKIHCVLVELKRSLAPTALRPNRLVKLDPVCRLLSRLLVIGHQHKHSELHNPTSQNASWYVNHTGLPLLLNTAGTFRSDGATELLVTTRMLLLLDCNQCGSSAADN